jgi:hypothetical protein
MKAALAARPTTQAASRKSDMSSIGEPPRSRSTRCRRPVTAPATTAPATLSHVHVGQPTSCPYASGTRTSPIAAATRAPPARRAPVDAEGASGEAPRTRASRRSRRRGRLRGIPSASRGRRCPR